MEVPIGKLGWMVCLPALSFEPACLPIDAAGDGGCGSARQDEENIMNSFNRLGWLTRPDFNNTEGADKASKASVMGAASRGL
jgi:hypothetical protein